MSSLFNECAARCVHLSPQEEQNSSSWGDSKRYTSGSTANSQKMLTEINKSSAIANIKIWVESNTVKYLNAFGIISSKMQVSLLILSWWYFGCLLIQRIFLLSYELKMFLTKVHRLVVLKNSSLWTVDIILINKL